MWWGGAQTPSALDFGAVAGPQAPPLPPPFATPGSATSNGIGLTYNVDKFLGITGVHAAGT